MDRNTISRIYIVDEGDKNKCLGWWAFKGVPRDAKSPEAVTAAA